MKKTWYLFSILFLLSIIFAFADWKVDGFDFFKFQEQHFYSQSWISFAGILFSTVMAITTYLVYQKTKLQSLKYIPIAFLLIATSYSIIGYHSSYCKLCSVIGYCAASHNYPDYLIVVTLVIFVLSTIIFSRSLDIVKKAQVLQKFSYGLTTATILLGIILFFSLKYLEIPDSLDYSKSINLQAFIFIVPFIMILWSFIYFRRTYKASGMYLLMALLSSLSFLPQIIHIYTCKECHTSECSEFYVFSGLIMVIVTGLFIHSMSIQLLNDKEEV